MLRTLPESRRRPRRSPRLVAASVVLHAALIGAAAVATARAREVADQEPIETVVFVPPPKSETPPTPAAPRPTTAAPPTSAAPPTAPVLVAPIDIPEVIPPPGTVVTNAADFANGLRAPAGAPDEAPPGSGLPATSEVWSSNMVEREVLPLGGASPRYPETLRAAGVEGTVVAEFVVDTTGRVEPASVRIAESAHPLFDGAVRQALRGMRFRSAEAGGRKVRQLVRQPFTFALTR